jgi:predicted O-methyltransferase YrrM
MWRFVKSIYKASAMHPVFGFSPRATMNKMRDMIDPEIERYATDHSAPESPLLVELAQATRQFSSAHGMMVGRLEGRFLKMLVAAVGAQRVLEIGTFTGYSALSMAEALPDSGRLITLELNPDHAEMARRFIDRSAHAAKIEVLVGPAIDTLRTLAGPFDFVFIDADKPSYLDYYEAVVPLLSPRGLIAVDNVFQAARVIDPSDESQNVVSIRRFNDRVASDSRVDCVMVPIRDGVTLIRRV